MPGQQDGEGGEKGKDAGCTCLNGIEPVVVLIEEMIIKGLIGDIGLPGGLKGGKHPGKLVAIDTDKHIANPLGICKKHKWSDLLVHGGKMKILYDTFYDAAIALVDYFADSLLWCPAYFPDGRFVENITQTGSRGVAFWGGVLREVCRCEVGACYQLHIHRRQVVEICRYAGNGKAYFLMAIVGHQAVSPAGGDRKIIGA